MIKKIFVTTFNFSLFEKYANKLIDSFIKTDQSIKLYCYVEDSVDLYPKNKNIVYLNLYTEQPLCFKFVERNKQKSKILSILNIITNGIIMCVKMLCKATMLVLFFRR